MSREYKYSMGKIKTGLLAVGGATIGVLTLRKLRSGSESATDSAVSEEVAETEEELDETTDDIEAVDDDIEAVTEDVEAAAEDVVGAKDEAITATKHAAGAVKHGGLAAGKAIRNRRRTTDSVAATADGVEAEEAPSE